MNKKRPYWLIAMLLIIIAVVIFKKRPGQNTQETSPFDRDPAALVYSKHARCRMDCRQISEAEVREILVKGDINYSKSEPNGKPDPKYALEGRTQDGQQVRIVFAADDGKVVVVTAIDLNKEWPCACN